MKKIIREEMDDFEWIRDVSLLSFEYVNNKGIEFNPPITDESYWDTVKDSLTGIGCDMSFSFESGVVGLFVDNGIVVYTESLVEENYQEHISNYANRQVKIIDGRELIPQ